MLLPSLTALQKNVFFGCILLITGCSPGIDYEKAEQYIKESEKQWAESVASGDTLVIQRILADDFIGEHYGRRFSVFLCAFVPPWLKK